MKHLLLILCFLISNVFAAEVKLRVDPRLPSVNEPFQVHFDIINSPDDNPIISFEPSKNLEVLSRGNSRISRVATYINGKMTAENKVSITYDLVASKTGIGFLRNIRVESGGEKLKHSNLTIKISNEVKRSRAIFVESSTDKEEYYVGESILVRYYIYNKTSLPLSSFEIKKFPKLAKFLKRYHQESTSPSRVQIDGELYDRRIVYTAQLFAEKAGELKIDPISVSLSYSQLSNDPFGGLLHMRGRLKSKTVRSRTKRVNIQPLPFDGMPAKFSGLVGRHEVELVGGKKKFLANEPIELKLRIKGTGALELLEAPKLINHPTVEEFQVGGELDINKDFIGTKTFDYTYLGRADLKLPSYKYQFSYFDPNTKKYEIKEIELGPFTIIGLQTTPPTVVDNPKATVNRSDVGVNTEEKSYIPKPIYKTMNSFIYNAKEILLLILVLIVLMGSYFIFKFIKGRKVKALGLVGEIKLYGLNYNRIFRLSNQLGWKGNIKDMFLGLNMSKKSKDYFVEVVNKIEENYKDNSGDKAVLLGRVHLEEFIKAINLNDS